VMSQSNVFNVNAPISNSVLGSSNSNVVAIEAIKLGEISNQIERSSLTEAEKNEAKSKLSEFLGHPIIAGIVGALAGKIG
jgi:hypothetical protein